MSPTKYTFEELKIILKVIINIKKKEFEVEIYDRNMRSKKWK